MINSYQDQLGLFWTKVEKLVKEGGCDSEVVCIEESLGGAAPSLRHWTHPYSVYKAFVNGLIDTQGWNGDVTNPSFIIMLDLIKPCVFERYVDVCKLSLADVYADLDAWTAGLRFEELAEEMGVDLKLVLLNALLWLEDEWDRIDRKQRRLSSGESKSKSAS